MRSTAIVYCIKSLLSL